MTVVGTEDVPSRTPTDASYNRGLRRRIGRPAVPQLPAVDGYAIRSRTCAPPTRQCCTSPARSSRPAGRPRAGNLAVELNYPDLHRGRAGRGRHRLHAGGPDRHLAVDDRVSLPLRPDATPTAATPARTRPRARRSSRPAARPGTARRPRSACIEGSPHPAGRRVLDGQRARRPVPRDQARSTASNRVTCSRFSGGWASRRAISASSVTIRWRSRRLGGGRRAM